MDIIARRPGPSVQEVFETDVNPAPAIMRNESPAAGQSSADIPIERYFSRDWHEREIEKVWRKTWQLACRLEHIPNIGDHIVYEIVHDSLIVIRTSPTEIRAYINSCLHRGTQLRSEGGCVNQLRCSFHGWTWESLAAQDAIWLKRLQSQTHAQPTYIAAVGSDTHVYSFQPAATQSHAQLLDLLNAMPELVQAEIDQRAKALQH